MARVLVALALAFVAAAACGRAPPPHTAWSGRLPSVATRGAFAVTRPSEGTLGYSGVLTEDGLDALVRAADERVHTLMVRSNGGEVGIGTEFGEWVRAHELDVVVVDYCLSSCANYVFTAGRKKTILPGAVVAWHGNARQRGIGDELEQFDVAEDYLPDIRRREDVFFAKVEVNECICRIGNERLGAPGMFTMSPDDMRRFGVTDIVGGPTREDEVSPEMRRWLELTFVNVPPSFDAQRTCR